MAEQGPSYSGLVVMPFVGGSRAVVVVVAGEADLATADRLQEQVLRSVGSRARSLVLDLTDLTSCDEDAGDALRRAVHVAEERGVAVSMRGQSPQVARMLGAYAHRSGAGGRSVSAQPR